VQPGGKPGETRSRCLIIGKKWVLVRGKTVKMDKKEKLKSIQKKPHEKKKQGGKRGK